MKEKLITTDPSCEVNRNSDRFLPQVEETTCGSTSLVDGDGFLDNLAVEIGDEVVVPSSPSPFNFFNMADSDHSYFSASRFLENVPQLRFSDCHLSGEPALLELPDLFDFNAVCQPFDGGSGSASEQRTGNEHLVGSSTMMDSIVPLKEKRTRTAKDKGTRDTKETDEESEECSSTEEETSSARSETGSATDNYTSLKRKKLSSHHVGPLPQTFIEEPGERRARFCFGIRTIVNKINHLVERTECTAQFSAVFEDHVFTLENVEKLIRFSERNKARKDVGNSKSVVINSTLSAEPDGDHLYAATMLTQTEKSGVTDHQYNEVSTSQTLGRKGYTKKKSFLRIKYQRERFLKSAVATIFSKLQRLTNRTGAKIDLKLVYEGVEISRRNYDCLETLLLRKKRRISQRETTERVFDAVANTHSCTVGAFHGEPDQPSTDIPAAATDRRLESLTNQKMCTMSFESDHDYDMHLDRAERTMELVTAFPQTRNSGACSSAERSNVISEARGSSTGVIEEVVNVASVDNILVSNSPANDGSPTCSVCAQRESHNCQVVAQNYPAWIRCAQPLCQYLVHPWCIGFVILNTQQLRYLPPYYCPSHRDL